MIGGNLEFEVNGDMGVNLTFVIKFARTFVSVLCPSLLLGKASPKCSRVDTHSINVLNLASPTSSCTCSQLFA